MTPLTKADQFVLLAEHLWSVLPHTAEYNWTVNHLRRHRVAVKPFVLLYNAPVENLVFVGDEAGNIHSLSLQIYRRFKDRFRSDMRLIDVSQRNEPWMTVRYMDEEHYKKHPLKPLSEAVSDEDKYVPLVTREIELRCWGCDTESYRHHLYAGFDAERMTWAIAGLISYEKMWWEKWGAKTRRSLSRSSLVPLLRSRTGASKQVLDWPTLRRIHGLSSL